MTSRMVNVEGFRPGMERQLESFRMALARGMPRRGWKIGINVPEVQKRAGLPHAGVGWLNGEQLFPSGYVLRVPPASRLHVEAEAAIRLGKSVAPSCSLESARQCVEAVAPALELVDYAKSTSSLADVIGHCMFHAGVILGEPTSLGAWSSLEVGFPQIRIGGSATAASRTDLVPRDLAELVCFVADYLGEFGLRLEPGDYVLSGSYTADPTPVSAGTTLRADFGSLGSVQLKTAE